MSESNLDPISRDPRDLRRWWATTDHWLKVLGPLLLLVFALIYYGQFYRSGLNLGGEGGTNAVIALRLMEGQRPIADTFLGYNVMWFYPIVWLFQITGPDFNAMRVFFYVLCFLSSVLGFLIVRRVTGLGWLALITGILLLVLPGMLFRNYMGLLPLLNAYVLLQAFVLRDKMGMSRSVWALVSGAVLGLTYLIRIDVGVFFTPIYLGTILLLPFASPSGFLRRIPMAVGTLLLVATAAFALHVPFYLHAKALGFEKNFVNQYSGIWGLIQYEAKRQIFDRVRPSSGPASSTLKSDDLEIRYASTTVEQPANEESGTRPRPSLSEAFEQDSWYEASFILSLYLPLTVSLCILVGSGYALVLSLIRSDAALKQDALTAGVTLGASLTLFPQYFFFRPDVPHLAEFMIPFLVTMVCCAFLFLRRTWEHPWFRLPAILFAGLCVLTQTAFASHAYFRESSGSIEVRYKRTSEFVAENGVRALVRKRDLEGLETLRDAVLRHSEPHEWVVTYPYSPTINFMTNRRSYLYNLYVDNVTAPRDFDARTIREIQEFRPAVIVIDDRAINKTDGSRFSNWARGALRYIQSEYVQVAEFRTNAVYARRDKVQSPQSESKPPMTQP
jgi:hypothetical protein